MPYIEQRHRTRSLTRPNTSGELNFAITSLIVDYLQRVGKSYQTVNDIVGALEGAKTEFQRRVVASYEDRKIQENGDVYPSL